MKKIKIKSVIFSIFNLIAIYIILILLEGLLLFLLDGYFLFEEIHFSFFQCVYKLIITLTIIFLYSKNEKLKILSDSKSVNYTDVLLIFILALFLRIAVDPIFRSEEILNGLPSSLDKEYPNPVLDLNSAFIFINVVLLIPIFEELFFRAFLLQKLLLSGIKSEYSILISSILFGLIHIESNQIIIGTILGLITGIVFLKKGIIGSVLLHLVYNFIWFLLDHFRNSYWTLIELLDFGFFYWLIFLIALITLFLIIKFRFNITPYQNSIAGN